MHYVKRNGATLESGSIVARLQLDDPTRVQRAEPYQGKLPQISDGNVTSGGKLNQVYLETKQFLDHVLAGYSLPEPYFSNRVKQAVETLMKCLKDPALPLYELKVSEVTRDDVLARFVSVYMTVDTPTINISLFHVHGLNGIH